MRRACLGGAQCLPMRCMSKYIEYIGYIDLAALSMAWDDQQAGELAELRTRLQASEEVNHHVTWIMRPVSMFHVTWIMRPVSMFHMG